MQGIDEARDTLLGAPRRRSASTLEILATPRGMAALAAVGVIVAAIPLVTSASVGVLGALAPLFLGLGLALSVRRRNVLASVALCIAVVASVGLVARAATNPGTQEFSYGGDYLSPISSNSPFARQIGIPLTSNPSTGAVDESIITEPTTLVVSCFRRGKFERRRPEVLWAYVTEGDYQTYWVPVSYLASLRPGAARTLIACSNWRWQLQNFGGP